MEDELNKDEIAEQAHSRLATAWDPQQQSVTDDHDRQVREQLEAVALLAYSLEPEAPAVGAKERLLDAVRSLPAPAAPSRPQPVPASFESRDPIDKTLRHTAVPDGGAGEPQISHDAREEDPGERTLMGLGDGAASSVVPFAPRQSGGWSTLALAAGLAFCLVGLGYLYSQLTAKNAEIAVQRERLATLAQVEGQLSEAQQHLAAMNQRLAMVNTVARQAYPMHLVDTSMAKGQEPVGRVFVCGQHQRWYLTVSGLEPAPSGHAYHLWFMTDHGPVDAGIVRVDGGVAGLQDLSMPDDTSGFSLTLEPSDTGDVPKGRVILIGDSPVKL